MNKKLTTIIFVALILLVGKADALTLTQKVGDNYIHQTAREGQQVRMRFINQANYTFKKWTVESGNVDIDTTSSTITFTMPSTDVVIRGHYEEEPITNYILTYDANGGTGNMSAQTVEKGESVNLTANTFTYDGYTFLGWSTDATATEDTYTDGQSITPTADMTLYAVWEEEVKYILTYDANNGSGAPESQEGTTLIISSTEPTRSGWNFIGWGTSSSATNATYTAGDSITLTVNTTLYAVWNKTITLTYDANRGSGAPSSQTYTGTLSSKSFTISYKQPTRDGKAFRGWATSSSSTVANYKKGASISISSDTTLYAVWVTPLESGDLFTGSDVGAYVTYKPSSTSYEVLTSASGYASSQTYDPSSYTNWRVFSNDGTNIEIISDESVGTLYLNGTTGYTNAIKTLQDMAVAYVNSTYATGARSLGYSEIGLTDIENYKTINTSTYPLEFNVSGFPYNDTQYSADKKVISNNGSLRQNSGYVWLASRSSDLISLISHQERDFSVNAMFVGGTITPYILCCKLSDGSSESGYNHNGVRPIVTLKSGLTITGGDGSPSNPYTME